MYASKPIDNATGHARSGVREVRYRIDDGAWHTQPSSTWASDITNEGTHTVEYYAIDNVGNEETMHSVIFRIDSSPPSQPSGIVETNGIPNNQWQKIQNTPAFTWTASSDATSGVWGYQFYFGPDPTGISYQTFLAADPRLWTPQPGGVRTGTYYLRSRIETTLATGPRGRPYTPIAMMERRLKTQRVSHTPQVLTLSATTPGSGQAT